MYIKINFKETDQYCTLNLRVKLILKFSNLKCSIFPHLIVLLFPKTVITYFIPRQKKIFSLQVFKCKLV